MKIRNGDKQITAILPKGRAKALIDSLVHEHGVERVNVHHARGMGKLTPLRHRGVGETTEKEIVTVIASAESADALFESIFFSAEINRPHGGLIFMQPTFATTEFVMPDLDEER